MNTLSLELWYDEGSICTFYTVKWSSDGDNNSKSETDKFFDHFTLHDMSYKDEALQLLRLITESIGNRYGATDDFFDRYENKAQALPPKPKFWVNEIHGLGKKFPLRLYCYRLSEHIVILFNGGIKDAKTAQNSPDLNTKFNEAQSFVKKIENAFNSKVIVISDDTRYLRNFNGNSEIIL